MRLHPHIRKAHFHSSMSIHDSHCEISGKRAVTFLRCIIAVLNIVNAILLGVTISTHYVWMLRETDTKIPIAWTDPLVSLRCRSTTWEDHMPPTCVYIAYLLTFETMREHASHSGWWIWILRRPRQDGTHYFFRAYISPPYTRNYYF